jgi:hypothetical protein
MFSHAILKLLHIAVFDYVVIFLTNSGWHYSSRDARKAAAWKLGPFGAGKSKKESESRFSQGYTTVWSRCSPIVIDPEHHWRS